MMATKTATVTSVAHIWTEGLRALSVNCDCVAKGIGPFSGRGSNHDAEDLNTNPFNVGGIGKTLPEAKSDSPIWSSIIMKVLVLGGGVAGVSTAWCLANSGHEVTVVKRNLTVADEASYGNAGMLSYGYTNPWAAPGIPLKALKWMM